MIGCYSSVALYTYYRGSDELRDQAELLRHSSVLNWAETCWQACMCEPPAYQSDPTAKPLG